MPGDFVIAVPLAVGPPLAPDPVPPVEIPPHDFLWNPATDPTIDFGPGGVNLQPGDIVSIKAGAYQQKSFSIENLAGDFGNRITIRNDPFAEEPAIFEHTGDSFEFFRWKNCQHFNFDGRLKYVGAPAGNLGITVVNGQWIYGRTQAGIIFREISVEPPTGYLKVNGSTQHCTWSGFELDGDFQFDPTKRPGIGFMLHDRFNYQKSTQYELKFRDNMIVEHYYIHATHHEAMYLGNNWANGIAELDADPRNCHYRYGIAEDCGWGGGQIKGAWDDSIGRCSIHHVASIRCGQDAASETDHGHSTGIQSTGSQCDIYNNYVQEAGGASIVTRVQQMDIGTGITECYYRLWNNVVVRGGRLNDSRNPSLGNVVGAGINAWHTGNEFNNNTGFRLAENRTDMFNNTIVDMRAEFDGSLRWTGSTGIAQDNLLVGGDEGGVGTIKKSDNGVWIASFVDINNRKSSTAEAEFVDELNDDYHLKAISPARNSGGSPGFPFPTIDHVDVARPKGSNADQGAFEFVE